MVPVFEQGKGKGIGYSIEMFFDRFIEICGEHIENKRAKSFAIILYDFHDESIRKVLKSQGGFAKLDRLSGNELSIFYINSNDQYSINIFNKVIQSVFEVDISIRSPFVLFFNFMDEEVENVEIHRLEQTNIMFAFEELSQVIDKHIEKTREKTSKKPFNKNNFTSKGVHVIIEKILEVFTEKGINKIIENLP